MAGVNGLGYLFPGVSVALSSIHQHSGVPRAEALTPDDRPSGHRTFTIMCFAALSETASDGRACLHFGAWAGVVPEGFPFFWLVGTKEWIGFALAFILARPW